MTDWEKCVSFHGHECGGLTIGYKAALYAMDLLKLEFSQDEQVVCISENDACGVDAIQVLLGCSIGKGNLLFHMRGKQAFSFYNRQTGQSVRLCLKAKPLDMAKDEAFKYYQSCEPQLMFDCMPTRIALPDGARIFNSIVCSKCGERTAEAFVKLHEEQQVCLDCYDHYDRFRV